MIDPHPIRKRFASLCPHLSERECRLYAAAEARAAGYGGIGQFTECKHWPITRKIAALEHQGIADDRYRWRVGSRP